MDGKPKISTEYAFDFDDSDLGEMDDLDVEAMLDSSDLEPTVEAKQLDEAVEIAGSDEPEILLAPELLFGPDTDD